ncbi:viral A-type inclusion protein [Angomonas deanei]|uniref:Uncharacterized protein n=1 Tax=Angomonas deanei TaxID=59799 RepID=A0A7G2C4L7_9TRYP|nr:viral A-type inclusion protein [Angomonas deanei]CAD2214670.1 hypothetical protein, conserved [Angomonas deanei]|eukprot:EPY22389.1 viral A-type inclusion protein [Angomonas deanei]
MDEKLIDSLNNRISQLEGEVRSTKEELYKKRDECDNVRREMECLTKDAHSVVAQWEKETKKYRQKNEVSEKKLQEVSDLLESQTKSNVELEKKIKSYGELIAEYSSSAEITNKEFLECREAKEQLEKQVEKLAEKVKDYESISAGFQEKFMEFDNEKNEHLSEINQLREVTADVEEKNASLTTEKEEYRSQAEALLSRVESLKDEIASLKANGEQTETELKKYQAESELFSRNNGDLQNIIGQQLTVIAGLESDLAEAKDSDEMQRKIVSELSAALEDSKKENELLLERSVSLASELEAVKECYQSVLNEINDVKATSENNATALSTELSVNKAALKDAKEELESALASVTHLLNEKISLERQNLSLLERVERKACELDNLEYIFVFRNNLFKSCTHSYQGSLKSFTKLSANHEELSVSFKNLQDNFQNISKNLDESTATLNERDATITNLRESIQEEKSTKEQLQGEVKMLKDDNEYLKNQVDSMRKELMQIDELVASDLNNLREEYENSKNENENLQKEVISLVKKNEEYLSTINFQETQISAATAENAALSDTLASAENELTAVLKERDSLLGELQKCKLEIDSVSEQMRKVESAKETALSKINSLEDHIRHQETTIKLIAADKKRDGDALRERLNASIDECESLKNTNRLLQEKQSKLLEEVKERCSKDAATIKDLLSQQDDIVEKYNTLHASYCARREGDDSRKADNLQASLLALQEENSRKMSEFKKLYELSVFQEAELEKQRRQNETLKKSVAALIGASKDTRIQERLNTTEGPLRHPRKRPLES